MENLLEHVRRVTGHHAVALSTGLAIAAFVVLDRLMRNFARPPPDRLDDGWLLLAAVQSQWLAVVPIVAAVLIVGPRHLVQVRWADVGAPLRVMAIVFVVVVAWRRATAPYDFLHEQWHVADRGLLVVAGALAVLRPVGLLPLVAMARLLAAPVRETVFDPGSNIDVLPVLMLTALAASTLLVVAVPRYRSVAVVPTMLAAVATQFWVPGWAKLRSGWAWNNEPANLPLNGYGQGWLGEGEGAFAGRMSDVFDAVEPLLLVGVLALELGALIVMSRLQVARLWLLVIVAFHIATLMGLGFLFFEFVIVELALVVALGRPAATVWSADAFRGLTPVVTAIAVLFGSMLFQPPTLAWYDANAVSRIDIDAVDVNGNRWALEPDDFAPYSGVIAFAALPFEPGHGIVDGYGSASRRRFEALQDVRTFEDVESIEGATPATCDPLDVQVAIDLLEAFVAETHVSRLRWLPGPPEHFQISRPGADYDFSVPIESLEVQRVTLLRVEGEELERVEPIAWDEPWC